MRVLMNVNELVEGLLAERPQCRNDDFILYWNVVKRINPDVLSKEFGDVLMNFKEYGLPTFESISRVRRKVQEENPELKAVAKVKALRMDRESVFREFSKM